MLPLLVSLMAVTGDDVRARMDADAAAGKPLVARVFVALADNEHQGIVPTSNRSLGDGQSPRTNLYWGALYGVRTHLPKRGWRIVSRTEEPESGVLERIVFARTLQRNGREVEAQLVAEAWDGRSIQNTIARFLEASAAGDAHVVAYVGHNGLMESSASAQSGGFSVPELDAKSKRPTSAIVLACASKPYFEARLARTDTHPLLLTTNLMAPEAYTLHAALIAWFSGEASAGVHDSASRVYAEYQKIPVRTGKRLFWSAP
jgi:hypothetical protein